MLTNATCLLSAKHIPLMATEYHTELATIFTILQLLLYRQYWKGRLSLFHLFIYFYFFTLPSGNSTNKFWNKRTICYFRISTMTALHMEIRLFYSNEIAELNAEFEVHDPLKWWYMDLFLYITRVNMMHNIFPSLDLWKFSFARFSCLLWIFLFPQCCPKGGFKFYSAPETS